MKMYVKKPVPVRAVQWHKMGDHAAVEKQDAYAEGTPCPKCNEMFSAHGWVVTNHAGVTVCPGDWIITSPDGENYKCRDTVFRETYEEVK